MPLLYPSPISKCAPGQQAETKAGLPRLSFNEMRIEVQK